MTYLNPRRALRPAMALAALGIANAAFAGTLVANYSYAYGGSVNFSWIYGGPVNGQGTVQFQAVRTGGTDGLIPNTFNSYCVEIGEYLPTGSNTHPEVVLLGGSTTISGGATGPVFFDATRTTNLQRLWAGAFPLIGTNANLSSAFQLAQWEITFDDDVSLVNVGLPRFWVDGGQFQAGITDVAEGWLAAIKSNTWTAETTLLHLRGQGVQDLVTPVPEPATMAGLALGAVAFARKRRKSA